MKREDILCPYCESPEIVACGTYTVKSSREPRKRFLCNACERKFSGTHFTNNRHQKRTDLNYDIFCLISMGMSKRDIARTLHIDLKMLQRKIIEIGQACEKYHRRYIEEAGIQVSHIAVDELLTYVQTRLKTVSLVCASFPILENGIKKPFIVDIRVATYPPIGYVARIYNDMLRNGHILPRPNTRHQELENVLRSCRKVFAPHGVLLTDEARPYGPIIGRILPHIRHQAYESGRLRGDVLERDATQSLNHTFIKMRGQLRPIQRNTGKYVAKSEAYLQALLYCFICHSNGYNFRAIMNNHPIKVQQMAVA
jgi:transposase-like protein